MIADENSPAPNLVSLAGTWSQPTSTKNSVRTGDLPALIDFRARSVRGPWKTSSK